MGISIFLNDNKITVILLDMEAINNLEAGDEFILCSKQCFHSLNRGTSQDKVHYLE